MNIKRPEGAATPAGQLNKYSTIINYTPISSILQLLRINPVDIIKEHINDTQLLISLASVVLIRSGLFRTFLFVNKGDRTK